MMNLVNLMTATINRLPETATDDPLLQPAVFAVLQEFPFSGITKLQDCKNCNCKWRFSFAGIHKREHHE